MRLNTLLLCFFLGLSSCVRSDSVYLNQARAETACEDRVKLDTRIPPMKAELTLEDIIEIASYNNLDLLVKQREWAIQHEKVTGAKLNLLPSYTFSGENSWRNQNTGSFSIDATTGQVSTSVDPVTGLPLPPGSIGSSQRVNRYDLTAAYNLVDFGISYFRARQEKHREVSTSFQYERQRQNIVLNVFKSYWKGIAAKHGIERASAIMDQSRHFQSLIDKQVKGHTLPRIQGLRSELQLVNMRLRFEQYEGTYKQAKSELAALMGIPPYFEFELASMDIAKTIPELDDLSMLEKLALEYRPELYAADAEERIFDEEAKLALVQMLPNLSIFLGRNFDNDRFLLHHYWVINGARVAWNLLALPQKLYTHKADLKQLDMTRDARLALSLGVLTQLHLAHIGYLDAIKKFKTNDELMSINMLMLTTAIATREYGEFDGIDLINFEADSLEAEIKSLEAYGEVQIALELINNSIGIPLYYRNLPVPKDDTTITYNEEPHEKTL